MSLAAEASRCEADVEKQCNLILKTDPEFWEIRNKAVLALTELVGKHERHPNVQDILGMSVFRLLKEPMKNMMADLRSQQVRDTCVFLSRLSQVTGDHMRHFLRDSFPFILDGVKVPNKVMSGFVDECIISMIKNTTFKTGIHTLLMEIKESKAKVVRERCLEYINEILVHWDLQDREIDAVAEAITVGLEDASVRGREIARLAYLNLFTSFPRKTEKLKAGLSSAALKTKLSKQEEQHTFLLKQQELAAAAATAASASAVLLAERDLDVCEEQHEWVAQAHSPESEPNSQTSSPLQQPNPALNASPLAVHGVVVAIHTPAEAPHISSLALLEPAPELRGGSLTFATGATPTRGASTPGKLSLRVRRQSCQEGAVTSIQAIIRGTLTRRQSLSGAVVGGGASTPLAVGGSHTPRLSAILSPSATTDKDDDDNDQLEDEQKSTPPPAATGPRTPTRSLVGAAHGTPKSPLTYSSTERSPKQSPASAPVQRILSAASPRKLEALTLLPTPTFASSGEPGATTEPKMDNGARSAVSPACKTTASSDVSSSFSPASKAGREIAVGAAVTFQVGAGSTVRRGFVRFVGLTSIAPGSWVGIDVADDKENDGDEAAAAASNGGSPSSGAGKSKSIGKARAGTANSSLSSGAAGNGIFIRAEQVLSVGPAPPVTTSARRSASPSTSRPLTPWVPTSPSPRAAPPSPFSKLSRNDSKRRNQVASLLKVKIAQLTSLLGQQLELVEMLESVAPAEGQGLGDGTGTGTGAGQAADVIGEILAATAQETQLIGNFQDRLKAALR